MTDLPEGFYAGDLYCFRYGSADDGGFAYIPGAPRVELRDGDIQASLTTSPVAAALSIQAVWSATPEAVEAAEEEIRKQYPDTADASLAIAEFSDTTATLTVKANGVEHTFGPEQTSGFGSYRVVFRETLTSVEKQAAISALQGESNCLSLTFDGTLDLNETAAAEISGDLADIVKAMAPKKVEKSGGFFSRKKQDVEPPPPPDLAACAVSIDDAIRAGTLKLTRMGSPNVSEAVWQTIETELRENATEMLRNKVIEMGVNASDISSFGIEKKSSKPQQATFHVSRTSDVGSWFARHGGAQLIRDAGAAIPEPDRS
jgi:hypothetical protein